MATPSDFPTAQSIHCPHCGGQHPEGAQFCPVTGQSLSQGRRTCPNCSSLIETDWVRCPQCGIELSAPQAEPTLVHPPPETPRKSRGWLWVVLGVSVIFIGILVVVGGIVWMRIPDLGGLIGGSGGGPTPRPTATPLPTSTPLVVAGGNTEAPAMPTSTPTQPPPTQTTTPTAPAPATATPEPSPTPAEGPWEACTNTYLSRLRVGDQAYVAFDPPLANRVRERPNTNSTILGRIEPGETIEILGGPACNTGWVWWEVRSLEQDLQGWTAEGDGEDYWLVPLGE